MDKNTFHLVTVDSFGVIMLFVFFVLFQTFPLIGFKLLRLAILVHCAPSTFVSGILGTESPVQWKVKSKILYIFYIKDYMKLLSCKTSIRKTVINCII